VLVGLHDVRLEKPTRRRSAMIHLDSRHLQTLAIPPGVAHGFYSHADSIILFGSSGYCAPSDYHRCRWDSPELSFTWPCAAPELSALDRDARGYAEMESALHGAMRLGQQACHLGWPGK
jgi:dTDP-4-dehydrorhamnose 3,5-epimerase